MRKWEQCKHMLCIRPDNMGDLLMTTPAIRALKETFNCRITVLTSPAAAHIAQYIPEIDDVIEFDVPWVKNDHSGSPTHFNDIVESIKQVRFDAAVVFTVYSQNPLPSIMIPYLANVPLRLGYCRENPYQLLTDWVPDEEPYKFIRHQVRRDLDLVRHVGAHTDNVQLSLRIPSEYKDAVCEKLKAQGVDSNRRLIVLHPGASEAKREYPVKYWIAAAQTLINDLNCEIIVTGTGKDKELVASIVSGVGQHIHDMTGAFSIGELSVLIKSAAVVLSVNSGPAHIAAACGTPIVVLYALTNPQHAPWKALGAVLPYNIPGEIQSKNEVVCYVHEHFHPKGLPMVLPGDIVRAVADVLTSHTGLIPELAPLQQTADKVV